MAKNISRDTNPTEVGMQHVWSRSKLVTFTDQTPEYSEPLHANTHTLPGLECGYYVKWTFPENVNFADTQHISVRPTQPHT